MGDDGDEIQIAARRVIARTAATVTDQPDDEWVGGESADEVCGRKSHVWSPGGDIA
jgi:hypothetical protein